MYDILIDKILKVIREKYCKSDDIDVVIKNEIAQILNKPMFTLQRLSDGVSENVTLDSILFFKKYDDHESIIRTRSDIYKNPFIFNELGTILNGNGFENFDRTLFVNASFIRKYDSSRFIIYFDDHIDKDSIYIDFYTKKLPYLKKLVGSANDIAHESGLYSPLHKSRTT